METYLALLRMQIASLFSYHLSSMGAILTKYTYNYNNSKPIWILAAKIIIFKPYLIIKA